jgi:hypothetical protein
MNVDNLYRVCAMLVVVGIVILSVASIKLNNKSLSQDDKNGYKRWFDGGVALLVIATFGVAMGGVIQWVQHQQISKPTTIKS